MRRRTTVWPSATSKVCPSCEGSSTLTMISWASPLTASSVGVVSPAGTVVGGAAALAAVVGDVVAAAAVVAAVDATEGLLEPLVEPFPLPQAASARATAAGPSPAP